MPAIRSREIAAATGIAFLTAIAIAIAVLSPDREDGLPPGSSFSHGVDGAAAAYQTLERLGYPIRRSFDPVAALTMDASTVLILADPLEMPTNADERALESLMAAGGTVLVTGCGGPAFLGGHAAPESIDTPAEKTYPARFPAPLSLGAPRISMRSACLRAPGLKQFTTLYGDEAEAVVQYRRSGGGLAAWWAGSSPISNGAIDRPGHLELLIDVVGGRGRTILWDEFYHGQRRSLASYAARTPLPWAAAQVLLAGLVAAAMYVRRRAPILERVVESRASPLEFVDTMAGLYARAGTARDAVAIARARLRRLLAAATGLAQDTADDRLAAAAAARRRVDANEIRAVLAASAGPFADDMTAPEALALVRRLQASAAALERTGG